MLTAMAVFGWLAWTSRSEPGIGRVAGGRPATVASTSLPDEEYELLSQFKAPDYTRQKGDPKPFQAAMDSYEKADYPAAASLLRAVSNAQPEFAAAKFYLGVSLLLSGDRIAGIQELRALKESESPYSERAQFYLAKGLISERDLRRAQEQLEQVVARHGKLEREATALLARIRAS